MFSYSNILYILNIKNRTRHHERAYIYGLRSLQGQSKDNFVVTNFWLLFWNCLEIIYFYRSDFPIFWDVIGGAFKKKKKCLNRRYPSISIFSKILLLRFLCKIINYNFTRLAMFYLKHIYIKYLYIHCN